MRARLERSLHKLGAAGIAGIGILLACAAFYAGTLAPLEQRIDAERAALERLRVASAYQPVSAADSREAGLGRFYALFPSAGSLSSEVERLHGMASKSGLQLSQGEYRLERHAEGLWAYRITLPVRGTYEQFRGFLSAVLTGMPVASLDALRFERKRALDMQLEAQVQITLHVRPVGDVQ